MHGKNIFAGLLGALCGAVLALALSVAAPAVQAAPMECELPSLAPLAGLLESASPIAVLDQVRQAH